MKSTVESGNSGNCQKEQDAIKGVTNTGSRARTIPIIPKPPLPPSQEQMRRIKFRRKNGLPVMDPSSEKDNLYYRPGSNLHQSNMDSLEMSFDFRTLDSCNRPRGVTNSTEKMQQQQDRINILWNGKESNEQQYHEKTKGEKVLSDSFGQKSEANNIDGEWVECFDEEIEATYYFNSTTGEATWINPSDKNDMI